MRDFPTIVVNLVSQLDTLLRPDKEGVPFVKRIVVDEAALSRNLKMQGDRILAEPLYLLLQIYGYQGDAHHVINHGAMPLIDSGQAPTLLAAIHLLAEGDAELSVAIRNIPNEMISSLADPTKYVGNAASKTMEICQLAEIYLRKA